jgi:hypothetical protein
MTALSLLFNQTSGGTTETGIRPLTAATLAEAIQAAQSQDASHKLMVYSSPLGVLMKMSSGPGVGFNPEVYKRVEALYEAPYSLIVRSPYVTAMIAVSEAKRRFIDLPALSVDTLNDAKVVVDVGPGRNFTRVGTIEDVVVRRNGEIVRPIKSDVKPTKVQNRMGATAHSSEGSFTFPFEVFEPSLDLTFVLIGKEGNFEIHMTQAELRLLR